MVSKRYSILLVEDDEVDIMNIERAFQKNNIKNPIYIARNGLDALNMLKEPEAFGMKLFPQIVLLDLNMPKKGGLEFLQDIRNDPALRSLTVFVMTTSSDIKDKSTAFEYNVAGYILKPLAFAEFVKSISILNEFINMCELPN